MKYLLIEIQTGNDGKISNIVTSHDTKPEAETKYHQVLAAAATSNTKYHSAVMLNEKGEWEKGETYDHSEE